MGVMMMMMTMDTCNKELSGENMTMAWAIRSENPMVMRVGCHEKRSLPGTAVYTWYLVFSIWYQPLYLVFIMVFGILYFVSTIKPVRPRVTR